MLRDILSSYISWSRTCFYIPCEPLEVAIISILFCHGCDNLCYYSWKITRCVPYVVQELLPFRSTWVHPWFIVCSYRSILSFRCNVLWIVVCLFVLFFFFAIALSVHPLFTVSDYPFGIFNVSVHLFVLFLNVCWMCGHEPNKNFRLTPSLCRWLMAFTK